MAKQRSSAKKEAAEKEDEFLQSGTNLLRIIDTMQREKNIPREVIFKGIEDAVQLAAERHFGSEEDVVVRIDRDSGEIQALKGTETIKPALLGRIAAQSAKQMMIQKIREAECEAVFDVYAAMKGDLVQGTVQRFEGGAATVTIDKSETILPRGEQIPGETHHVGERVKAVILDVRKQGHRVKIILSRTHPDFVRRLFEQEIPEIADRTIEIKAVAREAGYRTKIAVSSIDMKVDCVGACVGVRGSRIKNIVDELGGERIDIVRWNDSLQVMIPNALQPATIEEVFLYSLLGRAIVLVKEDQLSLAIGRRGQNVRLASKLVGWDIEIMTHDELNEGIDRAVGWFGAIPGASEELVEALIEGGFLSYDDLTFLEPAQLAEIAGCAEEQAEDMIAYAEEAAERVEAETKAAKDAEPRQPRQPRSTDILPSATPTRSESKQPTFDQLFGPGEPEQLEQTPTVEQVFGEAPPAPAVEQEEPAAPPAETPPEPAAEHPEEPPPAPPETPPAGE
jgi:N utilization substance protein A